MRGYGKEIAGYLVTLLREEGAADEVFSDRGLSYLFEGNLALAQEWERRM